MTSIERDIDSSTTGVDNDKLFEDNTKVFQNGLSRDDVASYYSNWAPAYDEGFQAEQFYLGPMYVAETVGSIYRHNKETIRVLDVAAGTGILGQKLHKLGFCNIDGLDPSEGMLDICRTKHVYTNLICDFVTERPLHIPKDTYDCVTVCGGMGAGHIPRGALREMIRITKPGGYICNAMRQEYFDIAEEYNNNKLDNTILDLEEKKLWKKVERRALPNYFCNKDGVLLVYQVM